MIGQTSGRIVAYCAEQLGHRTCNVAEYCGLIAGLEAARELHATEVMVRMDSNLVIKQMRGEFVVGASHLQCLHIAAQRLCAEFRSVRFVWMPRERNRDADSLANAALDGLLASWKAPSGVPLAGDRHRLGLEHHGDVVAGLAGLGRGLSGAFVQEPLFA